jgi:hypothetical protein
LIYSIFPEQKPVLDKKPPLRFYVLASVAEETSSSRAISANDSNAGDRQKSQMALTNVLTKMPVLTQPG